jgi:hypothetical protein
VQLRNQERVPLAAGALDYIKSNPAELADSDLEALAKRVAQVLKIGTWNGNRPPRFNESGDKALIDFLFHTGMDSLRYTATFHRIDGVWVLRGTRETYQTIFGVGSGTPQAIGLVRNLGDGRDSGVNAITDSIRKQQVMLSIHSTRKGTASSIPERWDPPNY